MKKNSSKRHIFATSLLELNYSDKSCVNNLTSARQKARKRFETFGIPLPNDEYWKFSSPERFVSLEPHNLGKARQLPLEDKVNPDEIQIFFVNGVLDVDASDINISDSGLDVISMREKSVDDQEWVQQLFGEL